MNANKILIALFAGALIAADLSATPTSASAATTVCVFGKPAISRATTAVGVTYAQTTSMTVRATNCSPTAQKAIDVTWETTADWDPPWLADMKPIYQGNNVYLFRGDYTVDPSWLGPQHAADYTSYIEVYKHATYSKITELNAPTLKIRRASRWGYFNATPEPVKKGKSITIWGWLERADWTDREYVDYRDRKVQLQFRTTTGSYTKVKDLTGNSGEGGSGTYTKVTAVRDGCFRLVFRGSSTTAASTSKADCIDVK